VTQDPKQDKMQHRALKAGVWATALITAALFYANLPTWAWGFLIGSLLSLFSMVTLTVIVPFLFQPGVGQRAKGLLTATLFMKLPFFCIGLYIIAKGKFVEPMAAGAGIALIPAVLTVFAVRQAFADARAEAAAEREKLARRAAEREARRARFPVPGAASPQYAPSALAHSHKQADIPAKAERPAPAHGA
jgi:hypothetical protein